MPAPMRSPVRQRTSARSSVAGRSRRSLAARASYSDRACRSEPVRKWSLAKRTWSWLATACSAARAPPGPGPSASRSIRPAATMLKKPSPVSEASLPRSARSFATSSPCASASSGPTGSRRPAPWPVRSSIGNRTSNSTTSSLIWPATSSRAGGGSPVGESGLVLRGGSEGSGPASGDFRRGLAPFLMRPLRAV